MYDHNNEPKGMITVNQEQYCNIVTSTATTLITIDEFICQIRSDIDVRIFHLTNLFSNNIHHWFCQLINTGNINTVIRDHKPRTPLAVKIALAMLPE